MPKIVPGPCPVCGREVLIEGLIGLLSYCCLYFYSAVLKTISDTILTQKKTTATTLSQFLVQLLFVTIQIYTDLKDKW